MPNLNKQGRLWTWLIALSVAGIIVCVPGYFVAKYYSKQRTLGWRTTGMAAFAANDFDTASDYLSRYLHRNPEDIKALATYVQAREQVETPNGENIRDTVSALKQLLGADPDNMDYRRHLLDIYMRTSHRSEALDIANTILAKLPKDARTLGIKYQILAAQHQDREALTIAQEWIAVATDELPPLMARVSTQFALAASPDDIVKEVQNLVKTHPDDPKFLLLLGFAYARTDNGKEALDCLKQAAAKCDPQAPYIDELVSQFDHLGISTDTISMLEDLVKRGAGNSVRHLLARRHWEVAHWDKAVELLADVNPADPKGDATLAALRSLALANLGKPADANAIRTALAARKQSAAQAWSILLPHLIDNSAIDEKAFIANCRQALSLDGQNIYLAYFLGDAFARVGELDLSIAAWEMVIKERATWSLPATRLVEALLLKNQPESAHNVALDAVKRNPTNGAVISLARAWAADVEAGNTSQAPQLLELVNRIQSQIPGEEQTLVIRTELLATADKKNDAVKSIRDALAQTTPPTEQCLVSLAGISRKYSLGIEDEVFTRANELYKVTANISYARAVNRFVSGDAKGGLALFDELAKSAAPGDALTWKLARARYLDITGDPAAPASWKSLGDEFPKDITVQTTISEARAVRGDWDLMSKTVERLKQIAAGKDQSNQGYKWRIAEARMHVEDARNDDDVIHGSLLLSGIIKDFPDLPEPHVLLARALVHMKRLDGAIEHLSFAAALDRTSVPVAIELAALLQSKGDFERVQQELDRITPHLRNATERREVATVLAESGAADHALQLMEQTGGTPDADTDLMKAMLYRQKNQPEKVEELLAKMLDKPDLATINFAASFYLSQGKTAAAEQALAKLDSLKLQPGVSDMIWGGYYLQTGNGAKSVEKYLSATGKAPTNSAAWRELAAVQFLLAKPDDAIASLQAGAKAMPADQGLANLLAQRDVLRPAADDPFLRNIVLQFLQNPLAGEAPVELMKLVIDERPSSDLQHLASRLQQFNERYPDFLPGQIRLAQCFADMHRLNDAYQTATRAMTIFPTDPESARIATNIAAAKNDWSAMRSCAETWKKRSSDPNADVALARALNNLDQFDAAKNILDPYLASATAQPDHFAPLLATYAAVLINQGHEDKAITMLWPLAQKDAQWRFIWIDITLSVRDPNNAVPWLDRVATIIPGDATRERLGLAEGYDILGRRVKDAALQKKATDLILLIADETEKNEIAQLTAASQANRNNDLANAEKYYRRTLALNPANWIANNNLAMLILNRNGDPKEALALAQAASKSQPRLANPYDTLAQAQSRAGEPKSAVVTIKTALQLEPDNLAFHVRFAQYCLDAGDQAGAISKIHEIDEITRNGTSMSPDLQSQLEALRKRTRQTG